MRTFAYLAVLALTASPAMAHDGAAGHAHAVVQQGTGWDWPTLAGLAALVAASLLALWFTNASRWRVS